MFENHVIRHLSAYHHGEIPPDEAIRIEAHLRTCARCRSANEPVQLGARLASALSVSKAPADMGIGVHRAHPVSRRRRRRGVVAGTAVPPPPLVGSLLP